MPLIQPFPVVFAIAAALASALPTQGEGQIGSPIVRIAVPNRDGEFLQVQKTVDDQLILTANESFFPQLGLTARGQGQHADIAGMNKNESFAEIRDWDPNDIAEWGLWLPQNGEVEVSLFSSGGRFSVSLDGKNEKLHRNRTAKFTIDHPGQLSLKLRCETAAQGSAAGNNDANAIAVQRIVVSGSAARGGGVIRTRWRPAAAHTKFYSDQQPESVRLWVMEMDAVPSDLGFYSPITTPFGYYGPSWNADGTVNAGFNFSLWSYGRNQPEPPVEQLSHLIAIGNPDASFDGFGHEGTGVKIRNWLPLKGRQGQRQAIALRVEPGQTYDTYHSYFYATDQQRWRLFGSGKKFNKGKPLESLWVGSFVEVPGRAAVQRTGVYPRVMRYRGWVMDENGHWFALNRMTNGNIDRETNLTHSRRGVTGDGWFFLETGGWTLRKPPNGGKDISIATPADQSRPPYLSPEKLAALRTVPCRIEVTQMQSANPSELYFNVKEAGKNATATAYWGRSDGLTFADRWEHSMPITDLSEGKNRVTLAPMAMKSTFYVRLLLKNDQGQFWSPDTFVTK
tara:strand:- start:2716 stop:4413 length:1698 start_codon:yes stop_codon:yes gene_type:complete